MDEIPQTEVQEIGHLGLCSFRELKWPGDVPSRDQFDSKSLRKHKKDLSLGFVAGSALYSKKFLLTKNITSDWIARVPESIMNLLAVKSFGK